MTELLREILDYYGKDKQLLVVYEELAELTQAITKHERGITKDVNNIIEETAHVMIIIEYIKMIYEFNDLDIIEAMDDKLTKLVNYKEIYPKR